MSTPLGVQLYTFRAALAEDRTAALARTAAQGFTAVEPFGIGGFGAEESERSKRLDNAKALRGLLDAHGLNVVATHGSWSTASLPAVLEEVATIGTSRLIAPVPAMVEGHGDAMKSVEGVQRFADALNAAAEVASSAGVQIGYHNHAFEWETLEDGTFAYDALVSRLDPRVFLEIDVYWAATARQDPAQVIAAYADRVQLLHVKDGPAVQGELQVPIGQGGVDNIAAIRAGHKVDCAIVELDDCAGDPFDAARTGGAWLVEQGVARWS